MRKFVRFGGMVLLQFGVLLLAAQPARAGNTQAVVNSDYVQVHEKPDVKSRSLGFLYKNMLVDIKSQTHDMVQIGKDSSYWFEVKGPDVSGWVFGKFLTPHAGGWNVDTYDAPGKVDWLVTRFGESTWYYSQKLDMTSFSMDDYRNLMAAAANGNEGAWDALLYTILTHLKNNPYDANYAYLKKHLYSEEYLASVIQYPYVWNLPQLFEYIPATGKLLHLTLGNNPDAVFYISPQAWQNPSVVAEIKSHCGQYGSLRVPKLKAQAPADGATGMSDDDLRTYNSGKIAALCQH